MPPRIDLGLACRQTSFGDQPIQHWCQRMVLIETSDLAATDQIERTIADADPFGAIRSKSNANECRSHAAELRITYDGIGDSAIGLGKGELQALAVRTIARAQRLKKGRAYRPAR